MTISHKPHGSGLGLQGACGLAAATGAALLVVKGMTSGTGPVEALLLVPFFFCSVPVLTYAFGEGLYLWNRRHMRFDLYDSEEHPVLSKVFCAFFAAAAVAFAIMLFRIGQ